MPAKELAKRRAPANDDRGVTADDAAATLSKVTPPTLHRVHPNRRLFRRLDLCTAPIVWIHGPPGAGKTTLAASYLAEHGIAPLWYRLDQGDADLATVFVYLGAAWLGRKVGLRLPQLTASSPPDLPLFTRRFCRGLFACPRTQVVVFDDYHEVAAGSVLHECLAQGLEEVPRGRRVVIVGRAPPPPAFARLRMNGLLDVVEPPALRLTRDEAEGVARERGVEVATPRIDAMLERVQGWTAGLILLVEADAEFSAERGEAADRLFDYFAGEILQRMPAERQRLLTLLALMPVMSAASAEALTGSRDAGLLLEDLRRRNYFTTRDIAATAHFRFHPLFRDFLVRIARERLPPDELATLQIRAAEVLEAEHPELAFDLLKESGATDTMVALIKRVAATLIDAGRHATLISWMAAVPAASFANDPWLNYWAGMAKRYLKPGDAIAPMRRAFALFESVGDITGQYLAWAGEADMVRSDAYGDMTRFDPLFDRLRALLARSPLPEGPVAMNVAIVMAVGLTRRSSDRAEIALWQERAIAIARFAPGGYWAKAVGAMFATSDLHDANFALARRRLEGVEDLLDFSGDRIVETTVFVAPAMMLLYRQSEGDCAAFVERAVRSLERSGYVAWANTLSGMAVNDLFRRGGDVAVARGWLNRMGAYDDRHSNDRLTFYHAAAAQVDVMANNLAAACAHADRAVAAALKQGWLFFEGMARVIRADVLIRRKRFEDAEAELAELDRVLASSATRIYDLSVGLLKAELAFSRAKAEAGAARLAEVFALSRQQGALSANYEAKAAGRLCAKALALDIEPDYVHTFIRASGIPAPDPHDPDWPWPLAIRTLGGFAVTKEGALLTFSRKTPKRLILLLKAIVAYGGRDVPEEKLIDALWPDDDGDAATNALRIAIHRLRKLLGDPAVVVAKAGRIGLDPSRCWLDLWSFEHHAARRQPAETEASHRGRIAAAQTLYRGEFLAGDDDLWWTEQRRARCRTLAAGRASAA